MKKMKYTGLLIGIFLLLGSHWLGAQPAGLVLTLRYQDEPLGQVLQDISRRYPVRFVYSSELVPVDQRVRVHVQDQPLSGALDALFASTPIVYTNINGNIVLRSDPGKPERRLGMKLPPPEPVPLIDPREIEARLSFQPVMPLGRKELRQLPGGNAVWEVDLEKFRLPTEAEMALGDDLEDYRRLAQVSLLPFIGTNAERSDQMTNNISLNLLWGANGGVDGMEVGGFMNYIKNDVRGVQVAGLGNMVGGAITGTQVSGLFNVSDNQMTGVQVGGLFNLAGETDAVQVGGVFNVTRDFAGVQVGGLFNVAAGPADGLQVAGLFNAAQGDVKSQVSGLVNLAGDVKAGQISTLLNVGKKVDGFQIALINVADSVSGIPIGLLNIVRKGYNRVELSTGEALYGNLGLKLGARSFYNIFHFGLRWGEPSAGQAPVSQQNASVTWGLGYGLGTAIRLGERSLFNVEAVSLHLNEREGWTKELNLLNQLRLTFDWQAGRSASFFAGPSGNVLVSKRRDTEGNLRGSSIAPYTLGEDFSGSASVQLWVGINAGVRF